MRAATFPPITAEMLEKAFKKSDIVRMPASVDDYWRLVELPQYRLDYINKQIIATMSYASLPHERVVRNLLFHLMNMFPMPAFEVFGSNRPIFAESCNEIYEPDLHIIKGEIKLHHYSKTKTASQNPIAIVEVHSEGTRDFDLTEKLDCYKAIPSVQQIIYIETKMMKITTFNKMPKDNHWLNIDYKSVNDKVKILNKSVSISKIYQNVIF
jgi:Uma2 family endonuclease